ncbi:phage tail protein [Ancylobacter aquaticus]|nr:phage tail protein [Ancylobacter aquaticus]
MSVLMGLGPFRFEVTKHAYEQLERRRGGRWAEIERLGRRPALQHMGAAKAGVTLTAMLYPEFTGGLDQVDAMGRSAENGDVHMMIGQQGSIGNVLGRWAIEELGDRQSFFTRDGTPRKVEVTITLGHYGDDGDGLGGGLW